jgi:hypothetical protein
MISEGREWTSPSTRSAAQPEAGVNRSARLGAAPPAAGRRTRRTTVGAFDGTASAAAVVALRWWRLARADRSWSHGIGAPVVESVLFRLERPRTLLGA